MARDKLPKFKRTNPKRTRFEAMVNGFEAKNPDKPQPSLASYARTLGADLHSVRSWAKASFLDLYNAYWQTPEEIVKANFKPSSERVMKPPFDLPKADPEAIRKSNLNTGEDLPW